MQRKLCNGINLWSVNFALFKHTRNTTIAVPLVEYWFTCIWSVIEIPFLYPACFINTTIVHFFLTSNIRLNHRRPTRVVRLVHNLSRVADHGLAPYHSVNNGHIHKSPQIDLLHPLNLVVWVYNEVFYLYGRFWSSSWPFREVSFAAFCSTTYNSIGLAALSDDRRDPSRVSPKFQRFC